MINTTASTTYNLTLTQDEFEVLHDLIDDTISEISCNIEDTDLELNDYELYHILLQMNRFTGGK